jgi:hypothetical protein
MARRISTVRLWLVMQILRHCTVPITRLERGRLLPRPSAMG